MPRKVLCDTCVYPFEPVEGTVVKCDSYCVNVEHGRTVQILGYLTVPCVGRLSHLKFNKHTILYETMYFLILYSTVDYFNMFLVPFSALFYSLFRCQINFEEV